jgi:hypothetical protein
VGRIGACHDDADAETPGSASKNGRVNRTWHPREHARTGVTRYGDVRHDTHGLHSTPGYRTPREAHSDRTDPRTAA